MPQVVLIESKNRPSIEVGGKDIILHILGELKRYTIAFEGAVHIANMSTEFGAIAGVCQADQVTFLIVNRIAMKLFKPDEVM